MYPEEIGDFWRFFQPNSKFPFNINNEKCSVPEISVIRRFVSLYTCFKIISYN